MNAAPDDTELVALCATYMAAVADIEASPVGRMVVIPPAMQEAEERLYDRADDLAEAVALRPAATIEGMRAKAGVMRYHMGLIDGPSPRDGDALGWSLLHDVLGETPPWSIAPEREGAGHDAV